MGSCCHRPGDGPRLPQRGRAFCVLLRALIAAGLVLAAAAVAGRPASQKEAEVDRLVRQLGSDTFAEREDASRRLETLGEPALGLLRQASNSDDAEVRRRARELVAIIERRIYGELRRFEGHTREVWRVAVSPDGQRLLTCSDDGTLWLWDAATGKGLKQLVAGIGRVGCCAFSPDGRQAVAACGG